METVTGLAEWEKSAGRWFRDTIAIPEMERSLAKGSWVPHPLELENVRHVCIAHPGHHTWAVRLKEHYMLSPLMHVRHRDGKVFGPGDAIPGDGLAIVPDGFFCWLWKFGRCTCGYGVRSQGGRMAVAAVRPPSRGAVRHGVGPTRLAAG